MKYYHQLGVIGGFIFALTTFFFSGSMVNAAIVAQATSTSSNASGGATTLVISKPISTASGEILIADIVVVNGTGTIITPPANWTLIRRTDDGNKTGMATYWKLASTSEPSSYTWNFSASRRAVGGIIRYSGVTHSAPIDTSDGIIGNSSTANAPSIVTTGANEQLVTFFTTNASNSFGTASGGMAERFDVRNVNAGGPSTAGDDTLKGTAGLAATSTSSLGANHRWIAQQIALKPIPPENTLVACTDGIDNDFDGTKDLFDTDCDAFIPRLTLLTTAVNDNGGTFDGHIIQADIQIPNPSNPIPGTAIQNTGFTDVYRTSSGAPLALKLNPGSYSFVRYYVDYLSNSGYSDSLSTDCTSTIAAGQTKTCILTFNDIAPQLVVIKHVVNNNAGTSTAANFTMRVNTGVSVSTSTFPGNESGTNILFSTVGSYYVTESGPSGYITSTSTGCTGNLTVGQTNTCVVTNSDVPLAENTLALCTDGIDNDADGDTDLYDSNCEPFIPRLTLLTAATNDNGGTFDGHIRQADIMVPNPTTPIPGTVVQNTGFIDVYRTSAGAPLTMKLNPGSYSFVRYYADYLSNDGYSDSLSSDCVSTIAAGESKTCTLTFDDTAPLLTLVKQIVNNNTGTSTPSDWLLTATGPTNINGFGTSTSDSSFSAGLYTLSESMGPSGYTAGSWSCVGDIGNSGDQINMRVGKSSVCTLVNDDN
jgi:hypothetical protein